MDSDGFRARTRQARKLRPPRRARTQKDNRNGEKETESISKALLNSKVKSWPESQRENKSHDEAEHITAHVDSGPQGQDCNGKSEGAVNVLSEGFAVNRRADRNDGCCSRSAIAIDALDLCMRPREPHSNHAV